MRKKTSRRLCKTFPPHNWIMRCFFKMWDVYSNDFDTLIAHHCYSLSDHGKAIYCLRFGSVTTCETTLIILQRILPGNKYITLLRFLLKNGLLIF